MNKCKTILAMIIAAVLSLSCVPVFADDALSVAEANSIIASGTCGTCDWSIDSAGTMTITEGVLDDWGEIPPWYDYSYDVIKFQTTGPVVMKTCTDMFCNFGHLQNADLSALDTSAVEDFSRMFSGCNGQNLDFSSLDTSNATNMAGMFLNFLGKELDISGIDFSSAPNLDDFLSCYTYKLKIGTWSRLVSRPVFGVDMQDIMTGIEYKAGDTVPAVDGHEFVRCQRNTGVYTITDISLDKNSAEWGDYVTVQIDYTGTRAPDDVMVDLYHPLYEQLYDTVYNDRLAPFEVVVSATHIVHSMGNTGPAESTFDEATGTGTYRITTQVRGYALSGTYLRATVTMRNYIDNPDGYPSDPAEFYDIIPLKVHAPGKDVAFDKSYYESDLMDALHSLNAGDVAILRPKTVLREDVSAEILSDVMDYQDYYHLISKEYYQSIKGKDVSLLIPLGSSYLEINGKDITSESKDVYFTNNFGIGSSIATDDDGNMLDYKFHVCFPENGQLPSTTKFYTLSAPIYDFFYSTLKEFEQSNKSVVYTEDQIVDIINNLQIYYLTNGELVKDGSLDLGEKWFGISVNHNSSYIITDRDPKVLRSFTASVKKKALTYTGKTIKPAVYVKPDVDSYGIPLGRTRDCKVIYNKTGKNVGSYSITVNAGKAGFGSQKIEYTIIPKGTSLKKVSGGKKAISLSWTKQAAKMSKSRIAGYQIQYATNSKFSKNMRSVSVPGYKKTSKTIKKLKPKTTYYVRIRTYMKTGGKPYYSNWSKARKIKTK